MYELNEASESESTGRLSPAPADVPPLFWVVPAPSDVVSCAFTGSIGESTVNASRRAKIRAVIRFLVAFVGLLIVVLFVVGLLFIFSLPFDFCFVPVLGKTKGAVMPLSALLELCVSFSPHALPA